jgi:hypothetical protein
MVQVSTLLSHCGEELNLRGSSFTKINQSDICTGTGADDTKTVEIVQEGVQEVVDVLKGMKR